MFFYRQLATLITLPIVLHLGTNGFAQMPSDLPPSVNAWTQQEALATAEKLEFVLTNHPEKFVRLDLPRMTKLGLVEIFIYRGVIPFENAAVGVDRRDGKIILSIPEHILADPRVPLFSINELLWHEASHVRAILSRGEPVETFWSGTSLTPFIVYSTVLGELYAYQSQCELARMGGWTSVNEACIGWNKYGVRGLIGTVLNIKLQQHPDYNNYCPELDLAARDFLHRQGPVR